MIIFIHLNSINVIFFFDKWLFEYNLNNSFFSVLKSLLLILSTFNIHFSISLISKFIEQ